MVSVTNVNGDTASNDFSMNGIFEMRYAFNSCDTDTDAVTTFNTGADMIANCEHYVMTAADTYDCARCKPEFTHNGQTGASVCDKDASAVCQDSHKVPALYQSLSNCTECSNGHTPYLLVSDLSTNVHYTAGTSVLDTNM